MTSVPTLETSSLIIQHFDALISFIILPFFIFFKETYLIKSKILNYYE